MYITDGTNTIELCISNLGKDITMDILSQKCKKEIKSTDEVDTKYGRKTVKAITVKSVKKVANDIWNDESIWENEYAATLCPELSKINKWSSGEKKSTSAKKETSPVKNVKSNKTQQGLSPCGKKQKATKATKTTKAAKGTK